MCIKKLAANNLVCDKHFIRFIHSFDCNFVVPYFLLNSHILSFFCQLKSFNFILNLFAISMQNFYQLNGFLICFLLSSVMFGLFCFSVIDVNEIFCGTITFFRPFVMLVFQKTFLQTYWCVHISFETFACRFMYQFWTFICSWFCIH